MRILGLDTSTRSGSVALVEDGRIRAELNVAGPLDHSERLLPSVDFLLDRLGLAVNDLDAVAVTRGPGSFTGVRVGLATAAGLARAAGIPAAGVPTLEALAHATPPPEAGRWICTWIDAGRREIYAAAFEVMEGGLQQCLPPTVEPPSAWLERLPEVAATFVGDGSESYAELLSTRGRSPSVRPGPWFLGAPVARIAQERLQAGDAVPLQPLYLRPPDARKAQRKP
jgi:tRNA threonylcarbamoyladenosine biosynthesis protein TsaB